MDLEPVGFVGRAERSAPRGPAGPRPPDRPPSAFAALRPQGRSVFRLLISRPGRRSPGRGPHLLRERSRPQASDRGKAAPAELGRRPRAAAEGRAGVPGAAMHAASQARRGMGFQSMLNK